MTKKIETPRFVLNSWHLLPVNKNDLSVLLRFLDENPNILVELNSYDPQDEEPDNKTSLGISLSALDVYNYFISNGFEMERVKFGHLANSKVPLFRLIKERLN